MSEDLGPPGELDPAAIARLESIGGSSLVAQIFGLVLDQGPSRVANAWDGYRRGDLGAVRLAAHSLRSSAGNIGATRLFAIARQVEELALEGAEPRGSAAAPGHPDPRDSAPPAGAMPSIEAALADLDGEWERIRAILLERRAQLL
jgi:HPt (histidine-containing phosphotransfer) domain-containing protein